MFTIAPLTPPQTRLEWGWIRNGLLEVIGRCHERYSPEDAWVAVQNGSAFVWRMTNSHDDIGFLLLRKLDDPDGPVLFLWAAWAEPGALVKHAPDLLERLKELAHRLGAKRIRFESSRKAWSFLDYFEERSVIYECEV
jgi:hypothetical protein